MKLSLNQLVQKDRHYAIVDESDSCLIDEARTPSYFWSNRRYSKQYKSIDKFVRV